MAVKIHGKTYIEVKDRVAAFHKDNKNGSIVTELLTFNTRCVFKTTVTPDIEKPTRIFTGHAYETEGSSQINKTSYLENCETSAIGRALATMGYGIDASFASANEVNQAIHQQKNTTNQDRPSPDLTETMEYKELKQMMGKMDNLKDLEGWWNSVLEFKNKLKRHEIKDLTSKKNILKLEWEKQKNG